ncbi:efflux RND transporter permease subunit [Sediminispirochaeta smaragdinae]|uniref:efflux RND transporter permease subunit n=1 Tax=Sediminispirochaeta smaragdinae TaxID=55206 RepID=UPI0002FA66F6|nr:efflux RND transporter permease subunit [Sediminispirochaeta smaragdinae]
MILQAEITKDVSAIELAGRIDSWLAKEKEHWPVGFSYEFGDEMEGSSDANRAIIKQVPLAFLLILLLLVAQFNSRRRAFVILVTIPFGFIDVVIGLLVSGSPFSFMSLLGLVFLVGIVVNNAISMIDRIETERKNQGSLEKAIIVSASKRLSTVPNPGG